MNNDNDPAHSAKFAEWPEATNFVETFERELVQILGSVHIPSMTALLMAWDIFSSGGVPDSDYPINERVKDARGLLNDFIHKGVTNEEAAETDQ